jgi:hypothetical protein
MGKALDFRAAFVDSLQQQQQAVEEMTGDEDNISIPLVKITLPDGNQIFSDDGDVDNTLSKVLGLEVSVMKAIAKNSNNTNNVENPTYEECTGLT